MEIITPRKLQTLIEENQRLSEGLLPELIKKLILNSCDTKNLRIPHGEDIWAPGFDGLIDNSTQTSYVESGYSVWECGTNRHSLKKIDEDYSKRTREDLGIDKKETVFYLVVPRIWHYRKSISQWEKEHSDWKKTIVYDASRLCDWINSEPAVSAWLLEKYFNQPASFQTVDNSWTQYSQKTNPSMTDSLFLSDRLEELDQFYSLLQTDIIRVKADSFVEAQGFVLSALMNRKSLASQSIIVNDERTYRLISSFVKNKLIVLNYPCNHDLPAENNNRKIVCYNKEDTGIQQGIRIKPLPKYHYISAFQHMGLSEAKAHELYSFSHGNLRTVIRRIPGSANDKKPEWANMADINLLAPLLFMRKINGSSKGDRKLAELLTGKSFDDIEEKYQELSRLEDNPVKIIKNYYILVNHEETWDTLGYTTNGKQYNRLTDTVFLFLDSIEKNGCFEDYIPGSYGLSVMFNALLSNYNYFFMDDPEAEALCEMARKMLNYVYKPRVDRLCIRNLSLLAEVAPCVVADFLSTDMASPSGLVYLLFDNKDYSDQYVEILFAFDVLTHYNQSVVSACKSLFKLCQKRYVTQIANSPEDSLITALCLINTSVALDLKEKAELIKKFYLEDPELMNDIIIKVVQKDSYFISHRPERKKENQYQGIAVADYFHVIEDISADVIKNAIREGMSKQIISFLSMYYRFMPGFLLKAAEEISKDNFSFEDLAELNYYAREKCCEIKRYRMKEDSVYLEPLVKWINATTDDRCLFHWLFHKYYDSPDDRLIDEEYDYETRNRRLEAIRVEALQDIISAKGMDGVSIITGFMENIYMWGAFLADNLSAVYVESIVSQLLVKDKLAIAAAMLDRTDKSVFAKTYTLLNQSGRYRLFAFMNRLDIDDLLLSEDDKEHYWQKKNLLRYDERAYSKLLKYYPAGLLRYCFETIEQDPTNYMDMVHEVLNAILSSNQGLLSSERMEDYALKEMMKTIDTTYYTDEWGRISKNLFAQGIISELPISGAKYFFDHPDELIAYVNSKKEREYEIARHFLLPVCVYNEPDKLRSFANSLLKGNLPGLLGNILGRSISGADGGFLHESIREMLEEINNENVDQGIVITYINNRGAHAVTDGSASKEKANSFFKLADRLQISYHHTADILRSIGEFLLQESKRDYIYSEVESEYY